MATSEHLLHLIQQELFHYFQSNHYQFCRHQTDWDKELVAISDLQMAAYEQEHPSFEKLSNFQDFQYYMKKSPRLNLYKNLLLKADPLIHHQFFISLFKKYPEHRQELINNYSILCFFGWSDDLHLDTFLDECSVNFKETTSIIDNFDFQSWNISSLSPSKLVAILEKKGGTPKEIDTFLFHFYSNRKDQMDNPQDGPIIRDFLLKRHHYDEGQLSHYFPFFNFLNVYFHEPKIDIFPLDFSLTCSTIIDLQRVRNVFSIDKFNSFQYDLSLVTLCNELVKYYNLTYVSFYSAEKGKTKNPYLNLESCKEIVFSHSNADFTKALLDKTIIEFFKFLKHNYDFVIEDQNVGAWLAQNKLHYDLSSSNKKSQRQKL